MGEIFEIRSCIEILANDNLKIYTIVISVRSKPGNVGVNCHTISPTEYYKQTKSLTDISSMAE